MPKEQVYQISDKSVKFWPLEAAPKFLTDRQTDRQLKLRMIKSKLNKTFMQEIKTYERKNFINLYVQRKAV